MGVDLGLGYVKVAVARPGKGLELVTNEQSKRKTPAAVGFTNDGERLFGDAAVAYSAKVPQRAVLDGRSLIGECAADTPESPFCPRKRLTVDGVGHFTGEEVVAMLLAMARRQASAALSGSPVKDVAVTVPAWYDERQRQAISDAARVIGLNCLGVVNANTAAAIKYALDGKAKPTADMIDAEKAKDKKNRTPKTITQRVMFYDLGASGASASIAEVTTDVKTSIASSVKMVAHAWDRSVGGRQLDQIIIDRLADAFDKQRGSAATPSRDLPRVMMRLRKEAQRAREVLSANTETIVSIASLHDDMDLRTSLTRADFERDARSMLRVVGRTAKAALTDAGLSAKDLDAVVPFGGTSRTPKVQEELSYALGIPTLNKSINTDEAAVMGSVFFAASLSSTFRVRKMDVEDLYRRSVSVEIEKEEGSGGMFGSSKKAVQTVEVFPEGGAKIPSKKTLSLNRNKDFTLRVFLNLDKSGRTRFPERTLFAQVKVKGVTDVLSKLKDRAKAKTTTPRVALVFHIDRSGLVRIGTAESSVDETIVVEREVEVVDKDKSKKKKDDGKVKDDDADKKDSEEKKDGDDSKDEGAKDKDSKDKEEKPKKKTKIEKSTQTVVHRQTLTIEYIDGEGIMGVQMSGKELQAAQKVLQDLETADMERVEREDALNSLEGFILEARSKVQKSDEDEPYHKVTTAEEREKLIAAFDEAEDWMYTDDAKELSKLRMKHFEVQKLFNPSVERETELSKRDDSIEKLVKLLESSSTEGKKSLEEWTATKSTNVKEAEKFVKLCEDVKSWVDEKKKAQADIPLTEEPVVRVKEVLAKTEEVTKFLNKMDALKLEEAFKAKAKEDEAKAKESEDEGETGDDTDTQEGADGSNSTQPEDGAEAADGAEDGKDSGANPDPEAAKAGASSTEGGKDEL